ncbi:hypothetical protein JY651_42615 [Pyxidicoccus parkwayensis]|uniref:Uncharacterized protein n=1 Tax=Pyxidicoccus parkwayensis TaxID=2813578 RepID=A0ABX7NTH2_9BACT|nr:hypothetical protein [Pyxidicoccus parkwaysis]QSQ21778.1 hypothetical protein JY651_42615 [Pyxidicoccus parkwaysis]
MRLSMEDYLRLAVPFVPPALVSSEALRPILDVSRRLPPCASSGFECRLGDDEPVADFLVNLLADDGTRAAFAGRHPDYHPPDEFLQSPVWQRVRDFCRAWSEPGSLLNKRVRDMWLEFDLQELASAVPIPGVFFGPEQPPEDVPGTVRACLELLRGPERAAPPQALARSLELPGPPRIEQVGMMFSRHTDAVRLCIRGVPLSELGTALKRAGWSGIPAELDAVLEDARSFVDDITLDIDVGDDIHPKLGLECILDKDPSPARWKRWMDHLVARGLCTPSKRDALLSWPGMSSPLNHPGPWPENLLRASERMPGVHSGFARRINHLKLIHQPGQPTQVKAYLAFRHFWFRHSSSPSPA